MAGYTTWQQMARMGVFTQVGEKWHRTGASCPRCATSARSKAKRSARGPVYASTLLCAA